MKVKAFYMDNIQEMYSYKYNQKWNETSSETFASKIEEWLEDNKDKGAFYTPKEIVHYMCQESLIEYLVTNLSKEYKVYRQFDDDQVELFGNDTRAGQLKILEEFGDKALNREEIEHIVKEKDIRNLTLQQLQRIDELLDTIERMRGKGVRRVPVVDSGGGLVGILALDDVLDVIAEALNALVLLTGREQRRERETRS